jgi:hypothetical protein
MVVVLLHQLLLLFAKYMKLLYVFTGLGDLVAQLDKTILKATGRRSLVIRVQMGGEEVR